MLGSLFNRVTGLKACNFLKNRLQHQVFPVDIAKFLKIAFLYKTSDGCFWQSYHGTVKSAGFLLLWFRASTCFNFNQKLSRNVAQIILYYHVTKPFLSYLNWLVTCFRFQNLFWENLNCFRFWWKTYTKRCTSNYVTLRVIRLFPLHFQLDQVLSISGYDLENGRMSCKQKYCIKNMAVEIPILILFHLCLLCWLKTIYFASCLCCSYKL